MELADVADAINMGQPHSLSFTAVPSQLGEIPGTPFAYWATPGILELFSRFETTEEDGRIVRISNETGDDFRFMRLWMEVPPHSIGRSLLWVPHAKGGPYRHYYYDLYLLVAWDDRRGTVRGYYGRPSRPDERVASSSLFFRPGLTYPRRTNRFSLRACLQTTDGPPNVWSACEYWRCRSWLRWRPSCVHSPCSSAGCG